jgi:hypothetical protein
MDPFTIISAATAVAKATGLSGWLGDKLGGKNGAKVAEQVIDIASAVTGGGTPEEIVASLNGNPELRFKLQERIMDQALEFERLHYADLANARQLQVVALGQDDLFAKRFIYYFAMYWSFASSLYIGWITFGNIPDNNVRFADTILGFILGTLVASIISYFFGSNRGSDAKNTTIAELAKKVTEK